MTKVSCSSCGFIILNGYCACNPASKSKSGPNGTFVTYDSTGTVQVSNPPASGLSGIKHDQDKPDMSLLSSIALVEVAKVMTFGKKKYSANNWRGGFAWTRPLSAALRHIFAFLGGEDKDPETGLSHLAHAICCLMFILEFITTGAGTDDRYKAPK